ncbi:hypothetical protein KQI10_03295 [Pseudoflavonifractor sp. MSJ-30]|nr:hypothetical protein [Pseudoflavonifractor sp. MSJ-30]
MRRKALTRLPLHDALELYHGTEDLSMGRPQYLAVTESKFTAVSPGNAKNRPGNFRGG